MPEHTMETDGEEKLAVIRDQVMQGSYVIEPQAVADALLRRLGELSRARREYVAESERGWAAAHAPQSTCSYPRSSGPSMNLAAGGPSLSSPIQAIFGAPGSR